MILSQEQVSSPRGALREQSEDRASPRRSAVRKAHRNLTDQRETVGDNGERRATQQAADQRFRAFPLVVEGDPTFS